MASKANKIRELQEKIAELEGAMAEKDREIARQRLLAEAWHERHDSERQKYWRLSSHVASEIRTILDEEIMWDTLVGDQNTKISAILSYLKSLQISFREERTPDEVAEDKKLLEKRVRAPHISKVLKLPTHRLLKYFQRYYRGDRKYWFDDDWDANRQIIKDELATRGHVKRKSK